VLKAAGAIDLSGVLAKQGLNTAGKPFQGVYFEALSIGIALGNITVCSNDLNGVNFSTFPTAPVRAFTLVRNPNDTASFAAADGTAPHLNTYSILSTAAEFYNPGLDHYFVTASELAEGEEDIAHHCRLGDEGDDAHVASTIGATEREHFVDAGQQHGPCVASGAAVGRLVGGRCLVGSGRDRSERHRRHGHR